MKMSATIAVRSGWACVVVLSFAADLCAGAAHARDGGGSEEATGPQATMQETTAAPASPHYFNWSDNSISLLPYGWGFAVDPSEQSTFTFEHAHDSRIGDLFLFVDVTRFHGTAAGADDTTWYG